MSKSDIIVKQVLQLAALTTLLIGSVTLLAPGLIVRWIDGYTAPNYHLVRFIGTALIGFAVTNWLYSRSRNMNQVLPAIYGNLTSLILAIIVDIVGLKLGMLADAAWLVLALHAVFAIGFLYCALTINKIQNST